MDRGKPRMGQANGLRVYFTRALHTCAAKVHCECTSRCTLQNGCFFFFLLKCLNTYGGVCKWFECIECIRTYVRSCARIDEDAQRLNVCQNWESIKSSLFWHINNAHELGGGMMQANISSGYGWVAVRQHVVRQHSVPQHVAPQRVAGSTLTR